MQTPSSALEALKEKRSSTSNEYDRAVVNLRSTTDNLLISQIARKKNLYAVPQLLRKYKIGMREDRESFQQLFDKEESIPSQSSGNQGLKDFSLYTSSQEIKDDLSRFMNQIDSDINDLKTESQKVKKSACDLKRRRS